MGRWLSKKDYRARAMRIIELRDKKGLEFAQIAKRVNAHPSSIERSYHQFKGKEA